MADVPGPFDLRASFRATPTAALERNCVNSPVRSGRRTRQRIVRVYRAEDGEFRIVLAGPSGEHAYRYSPDLSGDPAKAVQAICLSAMEYAWPVDVAFELQQGALPLLTDLTLSAPVQSDANRSFKPASCAS